MSTQVSRAVRYFGRFAWIIGGVGVVVVIAFLLISGLEYQSAENAGLEPGYTPAWILAGTYIGFGLVIVGALSAIVAVVAAVRLRNADIRTAQLH